MFPRTGDSNPPAEAKPQAGEDEIHQGLSQAKVAHDIKNEIDRILIGPAAFLVTGAPGRAARNLCDIAWKPSAEQNRVQELDAKKTRRGAGDAPDADQVRFRQEQKSKGAKERQRL